MASITQAKAWDDIKLKGKRQLRFRIRPFIAIAGPFMPEVSPVIRTDAELAPSANAFFLSTTDASTHLASHDEA